MLVSVIMPTRNRANLVGRAIESVLSQTMAELELIIVDDCSDDATAACLGAFADRDARIRVLRNDACVGAAVARNQGIRVGRGRYVAFIDDDAVWAKDKLERQIDLLRDGEAGVAYCPFLYVDATGQERIVGSAAAAGPDAGRVLSRWNFIDTSCVVVRRDAIDAVGGFDDQLPRLQDWDLWRRLVAVTRFAYLPEPLVRCYHTAGGISTQADALVSACHMLLKKLEGPPMAPRAERADLHAVLGHILMMSGAGSHGRHMLWRSVALRAWPPKRLLMAALSLFGASTYALIAKRYGANR